MTIIAIEMPLLRKGITCAYCSQPINDDHVYSVEGHTYRCAGCAKKLIDKIERLRNGDRNNAVRKAGMQ